MKIIFLDVDGVLNSLNGLYMRSTKRKRREEDIYEEHTKVLRWIIDHTDAKIVISSSWRFHAGLDGMREYLLPHGIAEDRIIDITPSVFEEEPTHPRYGQRKYRGDEIQAWLDSVDLPIHRFVIIDDESDMTHLKDEHLFQTNHDYGLTYVEGAKIIAYLNEWYWSPKWNDNKPTLDTGRLMQKDV